MNRGPGRAVLYWEALLNQLIAGRCIDHLNRHGLRPYTGPVLYIDEVLIPTGDGSDDLQAPFLLKSRDSRTVTTRERSRVMLDGVQFVLLAI
jgi:hypothetical protein